MRRSDRSVAFSDEGRCKESSNTAPGRSVSLATDEIVPTDAMSDAISRGPSPWLVIPCKDVAAIGVSSGRRGEFTATSGGGSARVDSPSEDTLWMKTRPLARLSDMVMLVVAPLTTVTARWFGSIV